MDNSKKIVDNLWITFLACSEKKKVIHSPRSKIVDNSPQIVDNFIEIVDNFSIFVDNFSIKRVIHRVINRESASF